MQLLRALEKPYHVNFEITNLCNFRCSFCSARLSEGRRKDLPTGDVLKIISSLAAEGVHSIFLTGGEPFLRKDLPVIVSKSMDCGMNVTLSTNGASVSKEAAGQMAGAGLGEIQVSIHGNDGVHDRMVGVDGAFEASVNGLRNLLDAGITATVASVATRENCGSLPALAEKVAAMGASYFRVLRLMPHSREMLDQIPSFSQMEDLVGELSKIERKFDISIMVTAPPGFAEETGNRKQYRILHPLCHTCTAGKISMGIFADGDCVPCLELRDSKFVCGNLLREPLSKIWDSRQMRLHRKISPENYNGGCGKCKWKWSCYSARCVAHNLGGDLLGSDISCYYFSRHNGKGMRMFHHYKGSSLSRSEKVEREVVRRILGSKVPNEKRENSLEWELKHSSGVIQLARLLAIKRGLSPELATVIAALHDLYAIESGKYEKHAVRSAALAEPLLADFTDKEKKTILAAIAGHSDKHIRSANPYVELAKDADVLDCMLYGEERYLEHKKEHREDYVMRMKALREELGLPPKAYGDV